MQRLVDTVCRRCGRDHDELLHVADPAGRWAVLVSHCDCGHTWTAIHTSPGNARPLHKWVQRGCPPHEVPLAKGGGPWRQYRLEGVGPQPVDTAS